MFAKKLGRFTAGLFVALGLAFGGAALAVADSSGGGALVTAAPITAMLSTADIDWQ